MPSWNSGSGRLSRLTYPNQQITDYGYYGNSGNRRLQTISNKKSTLEVISKFDYEYDYLLRISRWTQQQNNVMTNDFEYDDIGQLTGDLITPQGGTPTKGIAYSYDAAGNRLTEQVETTTNLTATLSRYSGNVYTYRGGGNPLSIFTRGLVNEFATVSLNGTYVAITPKPGGSVGFQGMVSMSPGNNTLEVVGTDRGAGTGNATTKNFTVAAIGGEFKKLLYDGNGNVTAQQWASGSTNYEWDVEDRLTAIDDGTHRSEFSYDGFGRRIKIVEKLSGTTTSTRQYVWVGTTLREERDAASGQVLKRFFYGGEQIWNGSAFVNYFFSRDHLGSVREMTDSSGVIRARYDYDPFGRRSGNLITVNPVEADFGFTGHYYHPGSGLHLALYRAYDADLGRWLNRDPIGESGGLNLYAYVGNDPISRSDPLGLAWYDGIAAMTGFGSSGSFSESWGGFGSSWSDSANSIGQAMGGALAGNSDQVADAYDSGVLGQTQDADPVTYYGTRAAVGTAAAATTAAVATEAAAGATAVCKKVKIDGPGKPGGRDQNRICQVRYGSCPLFRLDKNKDGSGVHANIGPGSANLHVPIWPPEKPYFGGK